MTDPKTHAERMAELLAIYDEHKSAGLIQAIDYADSIAAQLEAERSVNAFALKEQTSGIENERDLWWAYRDATKELKAAEEKLRAAERVVSLAKKWRRDVLDIESHGGQRRSWERELLDELERQEKDPTIGGAGEGVG